MTVGKYTCPLLTASLTMHMYSSAKANCSQQKENVGLNGLFSKYGTVERLSVREKDFYQTAFVKFADEEAAKNSIVEVNGKYFQGAKLSVSKGACWGGVSSYTGRKDYGYKQDYQKEEVTRSHSSSLKQGTGRQAASVSIGTKKQVVVTHVESCWTFWAQTMDEYNTELVYKITSEVSMYCGKNPPVVSTPEYNEVYAAVYDGDGCWYRCKVLDISNDECLIRYIDFGNSAVVDRSSLRKLPVDLQAHKVTEHFALAGLAKPADDEQETKAMEHLKASLTDKVIMVEFVEHSDTGALSVKAFLTGSDDVDVGEQMVREGLAVYLSKTARPHTPNSPHSEPSDDSSNEDGIPTVGNKLEQLQSFIKWTPSQVDTSTSSPVQQFCITSPTQAKEINTPSSQHTPVSQSEGFCSQHTPYAPKSPMVVAGATEVEQQKEIDALRTELERNRVEVHQLRMSTIGLENEKKQLTKECNSLKQNLHQVHLEVEMLQARLTAVQNIDEKVASCWSQLVKTHQSRATAMASGSSWLVDLVHVASTLRKEERVSLESMAVVEELKNTLLKFEEAQHNIRICVEKGEVAQLVDTRNAAREKLLQTIECFTTQAEEKLGDGSRMKLLKQCSDVMTACGIESIDLHMLGEGEIKNLLMMLQKLQGERSHEVTQLMAVTDGQVETCCEALESLRKMFSSPACAEGDMDKFPDINTLLDQIMKACTAELLVLSRDDKSLLPEYICKLLSQLMGSIQLEIKEMLMLSQLKDQYASLRVVVEESLSLNVHVDQLQDAKRAVRDLRRQYGHRLVDQREFSQDPLNESMEELQQVDADLKDIRASLHKAFAEEQKQSVVLSRYLQYLPEIEQLHPELGLQQCYDSDGLIVPGRDLEHFEVTKVLSGPDFPLYFSQFLDQHCVLREYPLDGNVALDRILENAKSLNHVECDSVVKVINISPNIGKKKVMVQLEGYLEHDLDSFLQQPRDPQVVKAILKKVLEGLHCFHKLNIVYGDLTTRSVRVQFSHSFEIGDDMDVQIIDFDLSKSLEDRCQAVGIPESTYPEATSRMAGDMYLFGKILLLAFCGQSDIQHDKSGKPSIATLTADSHLCSLLSGLLHLDPRLRISASSALLHSFF